jgi:hypothetical protein
MTQTTILNPRYQEKTIQELNAMKTETTLESLTINNNVLVTSALAWFAAHYQLLTFAATQNYVTNLQPSDYLFEIRVSGTSLSVTLDYHLKLKSCIVAETSLSRA